MPPKKTDSLHLLRQTKQDSFFLADSDEEDQTLNEDDEFDVDNMDFPLPSDDAVDASSFVHDVDQPLSAEQMAQIRALMDTGAVDEGARYVSMEEAEQFKDWMCVYPCYVDGTKTVAEGRRIAKSKACVNQPWAKDIVDALKELRFSQAFENELLIKLAVEINKMHAKEERHSEFSPLSPLTPLSIVMPGMATADPLAGFLGDNTAESSSASQSSSVAQSESKRQKKLAKRRKVMIRG
ncbi:signal recognition particle subunit [Modicella reniformis]|uniref:Signal recognition particle subunit n=1 Tax=Modicella reniformis TaxID=1440133 RepID=A0A9P6IPH0_9FUNG|nr:signal recognition particle subunit [Modicella reniformis]